MVIAYSLFTYCLLNYMHIIFYGPEGSGKGTQAKLLGEKLHIPVFTSGDLVREAATHDTGPIGDVCRLALSEGKYVPDSDMYVLWKQRLEQPDAKKSWIMDGFPRTLDQAKFLEPYHVDMFLHLSLSEDESLKRLIKRARPLHPGATELHDSPERIKKRLHVYYENEQPLLEYYRASGVLKEINGQQTPEEVHKDIAKIFPQ